MEYCRIILLYSRKTKILLNAAYKIGLFRVGCMVCPLSSEWWDGVANTYYSREMRPLLGKVEQYAQNTKPAKEVRKYIEEGGWKARMGGIRPSEWRKSSHRCIYMAMKYHLLLLLRSSIGWMFLPFWGSITELSSNAGVQKTSGINFRFSIVENHGTIKVSYQPFHLMDRFVISHLRGIAYKCAFCEGCKACMVECPHGRICDRRR